MSDCATTTLHIAPTPFFSDRGCHIRIAGIIRAMNQLGYRNILVTYHLGRDVKDIPALRIKSIRTYKSVIAGPHPMKYWADIKLLILMISTSRKQQPRILHAHLHEGVLIAWLGRWFFFRRKMKIIADLQGSLSGELETYGYFKNSTLLRKIFILIERIILTMADHIVVSSASLQSKLLTQFNIPESLITVITDGVDTSMFENQLIHVSSSKKTVIYTGSLLQSKGLDFLLDLVRTLAERHPDLDFLLVGYPTENALEFMIQHGLEERCRLTGRVSYEELSGMLNSATVAIDPKYSDAGEASGKILNYMAASLPIVCFDTENNRQYLNNSREQLAGVTLDEFIKKVEYFLCHPQACIEIGNANKMRVTDNYSWDLSGQILDKTYKNLITA